MRHGGKLLQTTLLSSFALSKKIWHEFVFVFSTFFLLKVLHVLVIYGCRIEFSKANKQNFLILLLQV